MASQNRCGGLFKASVSLLNSDKHSNNLTVHVLHEFSSNEICLEEITTDLKMIKSPQEVNL